MDQRLGGVVALSSIRANQPCDRFVRTHLDHHSETRGYPARRPGSRPSPLRPEDRSPPSLSHDGDMAVARAGQPREKAKRVHAETFVSLRDRSEAPEGVTPFVPRLRWLTPCSPFSTRCRAPRVAHEDGRPGWSPSVRTSCAEAHSLVQPREGMHFPLDRGAFHRWNPTTEGIAPWIVGQALFVTRPPWGFAKRKETAPFGSLALARS